jgi:hypothetical protein
MFVDDPRAVSSDKLDREVVKPLNVTLKPDPVYKKHCHFAPMVAERHRQVNATVTSQEHKRGMEPTRHPRYARHRFPAEVISHAVWLALST